MLNAFKDNYTPIVFFYIHLSFKVIKKRDKFTTNRDKFNSILFVLLFSFVRESIPVILHHIIKEILFIYGVDVNVYFKSNTAQKSYQGAKLDKGGNRMTAR